jgi:hypothetical protein
MGVHVIEHRPTEFDTETGLRFEQAYKLEVISFFNSMDNACRSFDPERAIKTINQMLADSSLLQIMQRSIKCAKVTQRNFMKYVLQTSAEKIAHDNGIKLGEVRNLQGYLHVK